MIDNKMTMFFSEQLEEVANAFRNDEIDFAVNRLRLLTKILEFRRENELRAQLSNIQTNE